MLRAEMPWAAASRLKASSQPSKPPEPHGTAEALADSASRKQAANHARQDRHHAHSLRTLARNPICNLPALPSFLARRRPPRLALTPEHPWSGMGADPRCRARHDHRSGTGCRRAGLVSQLRHATEVRVLACAAGGARPLGRPAGAGMHRQQRRALSQRRAYDAGDARRARHSGWPGAAGPDPTRRLRASDGCLPAARYRLRSRHPQGLVDAAGGKVKLPRGSSDAALFMHHVDRSILFALDRIGAIEQFDAKRIARAIEFTRFPVSIPPQDEAGDEEGSLLRAADLIGQLGDPHYLRKANALYYEFEEAGVNRQLGYASPADLVDLYPQFYWNSVSLRVQTAIRYLNVTASGRQWIANLYSNVFRAERDVSPSASGPQH